MKADVLVVATPVFFYSHTSYVQAFFERFQVFWVKQHLLKQSHPLNKSPKGVLISVGATQGKKLFECLTRSFKYVMKSIWGDYLTGLFVRGIDEKGEVLSYPGYLAEAKALGGRLKSLL